MEVRIGVARGIGRTALQPNVAVSPAIDPALYQYAIPQQFEGAPYYVEVPPQEERSVPMSWAFAGGALLGLGAYYAGRVATLGTGGNVRARCRRAHGQ